MDSKKSVLQTLCYSDIFDYPLTEDQLWEFLIANAKIKKSSFASALRLLIAEKCIIKQNTYFALPKREKTIAIRKRRKVASKKKIERAKKIATMVSLVPTIDLLGISGGLAMENAERADDIDFFIIAEKGTIWITRLLVVFLLQVLGVRRKRTEKNVANKMCANMFLDTSALLIPSEQQNIYQAHEIMQLLPLIERNNTYQRFITANLWAKTVLPHAQKKPVWKKKLSRQFLVLFCRLFEVIAKKIQLSRIEKHKSREIVSDHALLFHPKDYESIVLKAYNKRKKMYDIV